MDKREIKTLLRSVVVEKPCSVSWDTMTGDDKVRLCSQCNLNVHNISSMTDKKRQTERTCVFMYRKKDGAVVTENCPAKIRKGSNWIRSGVASALLILVFGVALSASASGGLVGAAVDPAFMEPNATPLADYGYDTARQIARIATAVSFACVFFIPMNKMKKIGVRRCFLELLALASVPLLVHFAGVFALENCGGLGGGV
jgi:hypothetical protein